MTRASELRAQYEIKIAKVGQWIAIRRYTGTTVKSYTDTLARAYVLYKVSKEFVGAIRQNEVVAIALVDTLAGFIPPVSTNDKLLTEFSGHDVAGVTPPLDVDNHVSSPKERAILNVIKRAPCGTLIAFELHAMG
jgi:hypothetical protein